MEKNVVGTILFTEEQIRQRAAEIAKQIAEDFPDEPVYLICTLRGAVTWMGDMMKEITNDAEIDFIQASSYGASMCSSGIVQIKKDIEGDIEGKNVIVIEDIVDTGNTLSKLKIYLQEKNPKCVKICSLLDKPSRRTADVQADYIGFTIDDLFVVGYGLDFNQQYRNLPYVSYLEG